jgi:hypothetical protein
VADGQWRVAIDARPRIGALPANVDAMLQALQFSIETEAARRQSDTQRDVD